MEGTLRVYVNGVRLYSDAVPVPNSDASEFFPTSVASESPADGTFSLSRALSEDDVVRVDFNESFASDDGYADTTSSSSS